MKEYYLKSVEGKIKLHKDYISISRLQKELVIYFHQIETVTYKIEGPYGKIFFILKYPTDISSIEQEIHTTKVYNLRNDAKEDFVYHFMLSFERMYENEFKLFKEYVDSYISNNPKNFNTLDIITTQEQSQQQSEQIAQLIKQKKWENEQYSTKNNFIKNIFFIIIGTVGLIALINVITYF